MTTQTALQTLQDEFCIMLIGSVVRLGVRRQINALKSSASGELKMYSKPDGNILMVRFLEQQTFTDPVKPVLDSFWRDPGTQTYEEIAFSPLKTASTVLNFWQDPVVTPQPGSWVEIQTFLHDVICDGNAATYEYLVKFLAHMIQNPEEKPGIMIVMLGAQGTGKGTFFRMLSLIWARTCLQVSDVDDVIGQFNASLEHNFIICMDEALFSGDHKSVEKLKSMITERTIRTEQKMQPRRTIVSYHRFFGASNSDHFAHVDRDDRRFLFLRVSSRRQRDQAYWGSLNAVLDQPDSIAAMVHDLTQMDLSNFNVRERPITVEHVSQKVQSLTGFDRYWLHILHAGELPSALNEIPRDAWHGSPFVPTQYLLNGFKHYDRNAERYRTLQGEQVRWKLGRLCPSAAYQRRQGDRARGYQLPDLHVARQEFEAFIGGAIDWDLDDGSDQSANGGS